MEGGWFDDLEGSDEESFGDTGAMDVALYGALGKMSTTEHRISMHRTGTGAAAESSDDEGGDDEGGDDDSDELQGIGTRANGDTDDTDKSDNSDGDDMSDSPDGKSEDEGRGSGSSESESDDGGGGGVLQGDDSEDDEDPEAATNAAEARKRAFFSDGLEGEAIDSFTAMNLSRPLLRAVTELGFTAPSLVQQRAIPVALLARDLCACATTGSGKTAAFTLPVLERLLFRPKQIAQTRVLVLSPTRELAVQVCAMSKKLAQFTDIQFGLAVGGMNLRVQESELRRCPDVVIATPGRLVDHITNTRFVQQLGTIDDAV